MFALKEEGKIRHVGLSFHDKAEILEEILTEYPQIEAVQIQFNYLDYEDPMVQSRKVYETAARHGKPVIVMVLSGMSTIGQMEENLRRNRSRNRSLRPQTVRGRSSGGMI